MPTLTLTIHPAQMRIPGCSQELVASRQKAGSLWQGLSHGNKSIRIENTLNEMTELTPRGDYTAIYDARGLRSRAIIKTARVSSK